VQDANSKKPFGASVRAWRHRLGISQEELAGRAGLHRTYVCDVERGARNVSLESIEKLARALEVSVPSLLSYTREWASEPVPAKISAAAGLANILFVEDLDDDVELTLQALKAVNIANTIHVERDGAAALEYLFGSGKHADQPGNPGTQLILLDLGLPKVNGLEVLRRVKADPKTRHIPVVVLTASLRDRDLAESKRLGADAYIVKPVDFRNLSETTPKLSMQWALLTQKTQIPAVNG
jgi:two-component system response regulator